MASCHCPQQGLQKYVLGFSVDISRSQIAQLNLNGQPHDGLALKCSDFADTCELSMGATKLNDALASNQERHFGLFGRYTPKLAMLFL